MSSRSSATKLGPVARLLAESLGALRQEVPDCYRIARGALAGKRARCRIDRESFVARFGNRDITLVKSASAADVDVSLSKRTILALIRNERSLHASVLSGELQVRGAMADVSGLGRSMRAFLHGAVRSPTMPGILARFERLAESDRG